MACINGSDLNSYICKDNKIGEGKEVEVYQYQDKVIKLFKKERKTTISRISDEGLLRLTHLKLHAFNTPIDIIYENGSIVGYTEKYLEEKEIDFNRIDFDLIKEDLFTLSENGFGIEDLFYNYIFTDTQLYFIDLTCYHYINTNVAFLKKQLFHKNIEIMNTFLIGLLLFHAFKKGAKCEYTKIFLANQYRMEHCEGQFYGDWIKEEKHKKTI